MSTFSIPAGLIVCEVSFDSNSTFGGGCPEFPLLTIRATLKLRAPKDAALYFRELRCKVSPHDASYAAFGIPTLIDVCVPVGRELPNQQICIEIPLDNHRLALFERLRKGGDFQMRLDCQLIIDELTMLGQCEGYPVRHNYALRQHYALTGPLHLHIPRSTWTKNVLPGLGFGLVHLIELPAIPIDACDPLKSSRDALCKAQELEKDGHHQECISKCRLALEPLLEQVDKEFANGEKRKVPALKRSWESRLGEATYNWLNASLIAIKNHTNIASHTSSRIFTQTEAKMILMVTTAVVAYAIQTMPTEE